jgi:hypothetical protein
MMKTVDPKTVRRGEWITALTATLIGIWLHLVFFKNAGGLWRDETGGFGIATLPSWQDVWEKLTLDSSPLMSPVVLRAWSGVFGPSDLSLRSYGLAIGLLLLGALWCNARLLGKQLPLISLGLLAANMTLIRWGDSVRAYGLGCVLILLTLGLIWQVVEHPDKKRFLLTTLAAILSVQTLYQNAFLLLAAAVGVFVVSVRRRQWKPFLMILGVGIIAALTLIPYLPGIRASSQNWWIIQKTGFIPEWVWRNVELAAGSTHEWQTLVWIGLMLAAVSVGFFKGVRKTGSESDLSLFSAITMIAATVLFFLFIWSSGLPTQVWYFLPLMIFLAACANAVFCSTVGIMRVAVPVFAAVMLLVSAPKAGDLAKVRQTNLDLIAAEISAKADPKDLIIIHPWYCGVTFQRYYKGPARWSTAPPMPDYRVPRFDLLKEQMLSDNVMAPVITNCIETLSSGHSLWLIGWFEFNGQEPPVLPKPPKGPGGWNEVPYEDAWAAEVSFLVVNRAAELANVSPAHEKPISPYENLELYHVKGWKTNDVRTAVGASEAGGQGADSEGK